MGSTVVCALVRGDQVLLAHMGDSRACRLRAGRLMQLSNLHAINSGRYCGRKAKLACRRQRGRSRAVSGYLAAANQRLGTIFSPTLRAARSTLVSSVSSAKIGKRPVVGIRLSCRSVNFVALGRLATEFELPEDTLDPALFW